MYQPSLLFDRTEEERRDMFASWARDDQAFFAAGACHILASLFVQLHQHDGYRMVHIKPAAGLPGNHVYATNGEWAFDHNGWTREAELLAATEQAYRERYSGWVYDRIELGNHLTALEDFCKANNHRLPWQFAHLPWERAHRYIRQFPDAPPRHG